MRFQTKSSLLLRLLLFLLIATLTRAVHRWGGEGDGWGSPPSGCGSIPICLDAIRTAHANLKPEAEMPVEQGAKIEEYYAILQLTNSLVMLKEENGEMGGEEEKEEVEKWIKWHWEIKKELGYDEYVKGHRQVKRLSRSMKRRA